MVRDQTDRVGAKPGRPFTLAVALWWPGPLSTVTMDPAFGQLWPSANLVKQACSCFPRQPRPSLGREHPRCKESSYWESKQKPSDVYGQGQGRV